MLHGAADAIEFVSSGGRLGSPPRSYSFGAVALTLEATAADKPNDGAVDHLRRLATILHSVAESADAGLAESIMPVFSALASIATRSAGSPGDTARSL
jgi:hypothetical protein